jgi:hypothetical protein
MDLQESRLVPSATAELAVLTSRNAEKRQLKPKKKDQMSTCCITALLTGGRKMVCEKRRSKKTRMRPGDSAEQPETASLFSPHNTSLRFKL